jgi:hypothetical protein
MIRQVDKAALVSCKKPFILHNWLVKLVKPCDNIVSQSNGETLELSSNERMMHLSDERLHFDTM